MHWPFADVFHNIKRKTLLVRSYTLTLLKGIPETDGIFRLLLSKEGPHRAKVDLVKSLSADISCCPNCSLLKEILKYVKILATFKVVYRPERLLGLGHLKMYERRCRGLGKVPKIRLTSPAGARQFVYFFRS